MSDAGKPIYSHHGDEDELSSLMAVMQVPIISFDIIRKIKTSGEIDQKCIVKLKLIFIYFKGTCIVCSRYGWRQYSSDSLSRL